MKEIFFNLKEVRKSKNVTQVELSEKTGLTQQVISTYERGEFTPQLSNAKIIADALGVSLDELVIIRETQDKVGKRLKDLENKAKL